MSQSPVNQCDGNPEGAHIGGLMELEAAPQEAVPTVSAEEEGVARHPEVG